MLSYQISSNLSSAFPVLSRTSMLIGFYMCTPRRDSEYFRYKDYQTVEQVAQRGGAVSVFGGCQNLT